MHVLILGAGFGGLELSTRLSGTDGVEVTLVDRNDSFVFGFSKLDVLFSRRTAGEVRLKYADVVMDGVEFRRERVTSIDPAARRVETDGGLYEPDVLVVALGADYDPDATPGFVEDGFEFYSLGGAERLRERLHAFDGGNIVIGILGGSFKCPPAPFEGAFLLHDFLVERGVRDRTDIRMFSPLPSPIPVSKDTSDAIVSGLTERRIAPVFGERIVALDPAQRNARTSGGETASYDLFIGIPVHRVPEVLAASALTEGGNDGWVAVDPKTLRTRFADVYALGDCADAPVPRAGVFAESAAGVVADEILARLRGEDAPGTYEGTGQCYIEFGGGLVGKVDANFLGGPAPTAPFTPPSTALAQEKQAFADTRRQRWFGG
jgi:sulfide:quinone oxidoreductase